MKALRTILGMAVGGAALVIFALELYELMRIGTCASGGAYVSARACPAGTGTHIGLLMGSIFAGLAAPLLYGADRGFGVAMFGMLFLCGAAAALVAGFGPGYSKAIDGAGAREAGIILGVIFIPMGAVPLIGALLGGTRGATRRFGNGPGLLADPTVPRSHVVTGMSAGSGVPSYAPSLVMRPPGTPSGIRSSVVSSSASDPLDRLAELAKLHDQGVLTDAEFQAQKARLLGSV